MPVSSLTARIANLGAACQVGSSDARSYRDQPRPEPAHFAGTGTRRLTRLAAPVRGSALRRVLGNQGVPLSPALQISTQRRRSIEQVVAAPLRAGKAGARGMTVWTSPPPPAGGIALCANSCARSARTAIPHSAILLRTYTSIPYSHHDRDPALPTRSSADPHAPCTADQPPVPTPSIRPTARTSTRTYPAPAYCQRPARPASPLQSSELLLG